MTTTVTISSPKPNHQDVKVSILYQNRDGTYSETGAPVILHEGESTVVYVHGSNRIEINEIAKEVESPAPIVPAVPGMVLDEVRKHVQKQVTNHHTFIDTTGKVTYSENFSLDLSKVSPAVIER